MHELAHTVDLRDSHQAQGWCLFLRIICNISLSNRSFALYRMRTETQHIGLCIQTA